MMSLAAKLDSIIAVLSEAREDAEKCDKGKTGSPGTRLRKASQEAKKSLDELRKEVIACRKL